MAIGKKKPSLPMYQMQEDTPWITRNRELNTTAYNNLNRNLNSVNVFDDATRQQLNAYNDSIYNRAVSDFDRDYTQTMNKYLSRDYNRFGTTGGTSSLLNRDNYNLIKQRELADMEYNRAKSYEDMVNQELQRRYNYLTLNNQLFNTSGGITQAQDDKNYQTLLTNQDRAYKNDVQDYNNSGYMQALKLLGNVGQAAATYWGGPIGYALSGAANDIITSDAVDLTGGPDSGIKQKDSSQALLLGGALGGKGSWASRNNLLGDTITNKVTSSTNSQYNPWQQLLNKINYGTNDPRGGFGQVEVNPLDYYGNLFA